MTKLQPKISIVTVVFNGDKQLQHTINSIVEQTYKNIEFIIVDGKSTDNTPLIIEKNKANIDQVICDQDLGIYDAMNKGVSLATGDYINFMNCGDSYYNNSVIEDVFNYIHSHDKNPHGFDVIYGDHNVQGSRVNDGINKAKSIHYLSQGMVCCHQSTFFKSDILKQCPYSLNFASAGDYELYCHLKHLKAKFFKLPNLVVANYAAGGVSDVQRVSSLQNSKIAYQQYFPLSVLDKIKWLYRLTRAYFSCKIMQLLSRGAK
ncbi:glycosyltransferase family 2 protein [Thalassotalea psychrophila]|uniref:Glycosyltransferase family 2 protein n=1 Tax=Thalassotalea psychrophila TaxID=3065647 RepID=A0ABY9TQZ4_9GAMM|nr:glycosyltransferase family 2 protein [Colwelliaceae bacterium SQ149]